MIKRDKLLHMIAGVLILCFGLVIGLGYLFAFVLVVVVAAAKEVYDYFNKDKHTPDILDFVATISLAAIVDATFWFSKNIEFPYMLFVG